jgi:hypothetical protein
MICSGKKMRERERERGWVCIYQDLCKNNQEEFGERDKEQDKYLN